MPGLAEQPLPLDLDSLSDAAASLPVGQGAAYGEAFGQALDPKVAGSFLLDQGRRISDAYATAPALPFGQPLSAGQAAARGTPLVTPPKLDPEDANQRFGIPGALRFNQPTYEDEAAFLSAQARERQFGEWLDERSNASPLGLLGVQLAGSLINPANVGLMALTDGFAGGALELAGLRGAADAAGAIGKLGKVANVVGEGALAQGPFVAANAGLAAYQQEPYGFGDALRDIAAGAILHTGVHYALRAAGALGGIDEPGPAPARGVPPEVDALPAESRAGAFALAVDRMANDRPVDVGGLVDRELNPPAMERLNETGAAPAIDSWRPLEADTAVTTRGTEVPVRYGLVELGDLVTSHDDNLSVNPAYPPELQPRARERAGAQARNYQLEKELNPKLLMNDVGAGAGAPIVAPDGVVESGNGRTIALRRSAAAGGEAYGRYLAELKARNVDISGMRQPVLVRLRTQPMEGAARAALAREMNADVTERMSGTEQAMADAQRLDDASFDKIRDNQTPTSSRDFARDFIAKVAPDQANVLANKDGALSPEGLRRIRAAVLARAYGDERLVGQVFEDEDSPARKLGEALADAAPAWARLRAAVASGKVAPAMDLTEALKSALDLVRFAKSEGKALGEVVDGLIGQKDMFTGDAISPYTEAFLRLFYADAGFEKPTAPAQIAATLRDYVRQAVKVKPGQNLFGETAGEDTARTILKSAAEKFAAGDAGNLDVRPPGRAAKPADAARPAVVDLRQPGGERDGGGPGLSPEGQPGPGGEGGRAEPGAPARLTGDQIIAADPELKAMAEDTGRLAAENGLEAPAEPKTDPDTVAEAIRAAAVCLGEEGL